MKQNTTQESSETWTHVTNWY